MKEENKLFFKNIYNRNTNGSFRVNNIYSWLIYKPILTTCNVIGDIIRNYVTNSTKQTIKNLLKNSPQKKGIILKILILKPKKPNSANRKIAKVKITNRSSNGEGNGNTIIRAYIPGEGHTLHIHNNVLIKGGKTKDLPGINYKIIRGALDCAGVLRSKKRSKYGCKKPNN